SGSEGRARHRLTGFWSCTVEAFSTDPNGMRTAHGTIRTEPPSAWRDPRPDCRRSLDLIEMGVERRPVRVIFRPPASPENIFAFTDAVRKHPRAVSVAPERRHWGIFRDLVVQTGIRGSGTT